MLLTGVFLPILCVGVGVAPVPDDPGLRATVIRGAPLSFLFSYEEGWGTQLDTYHNLLTKDLVSRRDTTIYFRLPEADVDSVYWEMGHIRFFDRSRPQPPWPICNVDLDPSTSVRVTASLGKDTRTLEWNTGREWACKDENGDWQRVKELRALILRIIRCQPEYNALPRPSGGYY